MKHISLAIGLILLIAGSVLLVMDQTTYGLVSSQTYPVDFTFSLALPFQTYKNQTYVMNSLTEFIHAQFLDKIVITTELTSNNSGNWPTVFIQYYDLNFVYQNGSLEDPPSLTYNTEEFPIYSAIVGQDTGLSNFDTYAIRFGAISTFNVSDGTASKLAHLSEMGTYRVTISVYSKSANSLFLTLGVLLLNDGVIISLIAYTKREQAKRTASMF